MITVSRSAIVMITVSRSRQAASDCLRLLSRSRTITRLLLTHSASCNPPNMLFRCFGSYYNCNSNIICSFLTSSNSSNSSNSNNRIKSLSLFNARHFSSSSSSSSSSSFQALKSAIKDLSGQDSFMVSVSSPEDLIAWKSLPMEQLEIDQLEELARALFEGGVEGLDADVDCAVEMWKHADKRGSIEARYCIASCIRDGIVFEENPVLAYKMFEDLAKNRDFPIAFYMLGLMLNRGLGVENNPEEAFKCFKIASDRGVVRAYYDLSTFYDSGKIVPKNESLAVKCLEVAVETGDLLAKHALALHLYKGLGCDVDRVRAFELQMQAADGGHPAALFNVAVHYLAGK